MIFDAKISIWARVFYFLCSCVLLSSCTQSTKETLKVVGEHREALVCFYNVENLFDTIDDPKTNDNEFLTNSKKEWDYYKYMNKSNRIAQTMRAIGEISFPKIIGLCEVENKMVLQDLLLRPAFQNKDYGIIHQESPDARGIDVGLLYAKDYFSEISRDFIPVNSRDRHVRSRDILYTALVTDTDTFHLYVNHWSSRRGGQLKSEPKRKYAASLLSTHLDSVQGAFSDAHVIIMGDFNDDPWSESVKTLEDDNEMINLSLTLDECGTTYYKKDWYCFDQMLVSKSLINSNFPYVPEMNVARFDFLSKETSDGVKVPNRTYKGHFYNNGFSDHYPVFMNLYY